MRKLSILLLICLLMNLITGTVVYFMMKAQVKKTVVVDAVRLFNEYRMKKDLEKEVEVRLKSYERLIDSLGQQIRAYAHQSEVPESLLQRYQQVRQDLDTDYGESNRSINEQVWKRLNPLMTEYGQEHQLNLIIGANGMGSVLYNDKAYDKTDALIRYVNEDYEDR